MAKAKTNGTVYAIEIKKDAWRFNDDTWALLTAIRPSTDRKKVMDDLNKYVGKRTWPCLYRISLFKRMKSTAIDIGNMHGLPSVLTK